MSSSAKGVVDSEIRRRSQEGPFMLQFRRHQQNLRGPCSKPWTLQFVYHLIHLVCRKNIFLGIHKQQTPQRLCIPGNKFEEFKFLSTPLKFVKDYPLDVGCQAFNWSCVPPEFGMVLPIGFKGRIVHDRLQIHNK